ncbi:asparagine synthase (glutamine-hydrolyzing) [bacterium]|nr:asparagine synthase (glutamine-hydrolyzing) [bacterium]
MCGIAGIYLNSPKEAAFLLEKVSSIVSAISHRGPDGHGTWADAQGQLVLGHARLAIIDLSKDGKQPMLSQSGNFVLTFNGEIYNYVELREELAGMGVQFRGTSDTEVLLEAMERWGIEKTLKRARGMFAVALWDIKKKILWLGRDRVGKKPLYVYQDHQCLVFASEIKGILKYPDISVNLSSQALSDYLTLGFVVGPQTIYKEITEINPGTLVCFKENFTVREEINYWSFPNEASRILSPQEIEKETERLLNEAIKLRLRADVPVGVFLSGGIDSGLITAMAALQSSQPLQTFTVSFGNSSFDESHLASLVAERYHTQHREIRLDPDLRDLLPQIVRTYDEPFADPSAVPTYAISQEASRYVKVVLNGEGSDELFGGYRRTYAMRWLQKIQFILQLLPQGSLGGLAKILPQPQGFRNAYSFFHRFIRAAQADAQTRYLLWSSDGFDEEEKAFLGKNSFHNQLSTREVLSERLSDYSSLPPLAQFMAFDFLVGMADCLLPKIDMATMAHGLEGRSPFLDQELVYWVAGLDKRNLLSGGDTKPVLRSIAKRYLPDGIVSAPKRGFEMPLVRWMKEDLYDMARDTCLSQNSILFDMFDRDQVSALVNRQTSLDDERWAKRLWTFFMLASWGKYK